MAERNPGVKNFTYADDLLPLNALRTVRNRIAHHEPVFARDLARDHERIVEVVGWITPGTRRWVEHHSRVPAILDTARDAGAIRF